MSRIEKYVELRKSAYARYLMQVHDVSRKWVTNQATVRRFNQFYMEYSFRYEIYYTHAQTLSFFWLPLKFTFAALNQ